MKAISKKVVEMHDQKTNTIGEREILEHTRNCPFIVNMKYAFQTAKKLYIILELMLGGELFYHIRSWVKFSEDMAKFYLA